MSKTLRQYDAAQIDAKTLEILRTRSSFSWMKLTTSQPSIYFEFERGERRYLTAAACGSL